MSNADVFGGSAILQRRGRLWLRRSRHGCSLRCNWADGGLAIGLRCSETSGDEAVGYLTLRMPDKVYFVETAPRFHAAGRDADGLRLSGHWAEFLSAACLQRSRGDR